MASKEQIDFIFNNIFNENEKLNNVKTKFDEHYQIEDQFALLNGLCTLLIDGLLEPTQQVIVLWIIYKIFDRFNIRDNPYYYVFYLVYQSCSSGSHTFHNRIFEFVSCILSSVSVDENGIFSANEIFNQAQSIPLSSASVDSSLIEDASVNRLSPLIISKPDPNDPQITHNQLLRELLSEPSLICDFEVPFLRISPELMPVNQEEYQFMTINSNSDLPYVLDEEDSLNRAFAIEILIKESFVAKLEDDQTRYLIKSIRNEPFILDSLSLSMKDIERILSINTKVGAVILSQLCQKSHSFYDYISDMDLNEVSIEVIKAVMLTNLPSVSFLDKFIKKSIDRIYCIKDIKDLRNRLSMFCDLMIYMYKSDFQFSSTIILDIQSMKINFTSKGYNEVNALAIFLE